MELIDTCWDVNERLESLSMYLLIGINRYMLGCKSLQPRVAQQSKLGINRYMLGCKL